MNEYTIKDIEVGMTESFQKQITLEMENAFRIISGDENPLHKDDEFAKSIGEGKFRQHVSFGMLTASLYSTLAGMYLPGKYSLIHSLDIKFQKPVYVQDTLTVTGKVAKIHEELKLLEVKVKIENQNKECVSKADMRILVLK